MNDNSKYVQANKILSEMKEIMISSGIDESDPVFGQLLFEEQQLHELNEEIIDKIIKEYAPLIENYNLGDAIDLSMSEFEKIAIAKKVVNDLIAKKTSKGFDDTDAELAVLIKDKKLIEMGDFEAIERALNIYFYKQGKI